MTARRHKPVILRSPPFLLADDEGSLQFTGNVRCSIIQRTAGILRPPKNRGLRMTGGPMVFCVLPAIEKNDWTLSAASTTLKIWHWVNLM